MGVYDVAEVCELVGNSLLSQLRKRYDERYIGFYRNDELAVFQNKSDPKQLVTATCQN